MGEVLRFGKAIEKIEAIHIEVSLLNMYMFFVLVLQLAAIKQSQSIAMPDYRFYKPSIKYDGVNPCTKCKHFIPFTEILDPYYHYENDMRPSCQKFKCTEPLYGEMVYEYADMCRQNETLCGILGIRFEER